MRFYTGKMSRCMLGTKNNGGEFDDTCFEVLRLTHEECPACDDDAGTKPPQCIIYACTLLVVRTRQDSAYAAATHPDIM